MNNEQTLELQIKAKAQEAKSNVDSLVKSLTNIENVLTNIHSELGSIEKKTDSTTNKVNNDVKKLDSNINNVTKSSNKLGNTLKNVFTFAGVKKVSSTFLKWLNESVNYTEQLNLFNVVFDNVEKNGKQAFSELGKSATRFQYKLNEVFGTNKTETLYMQGIFQSMGETVGIKDNYSAIMSETMTKLTYDLASLYNKTEESTAEALRAGVYAGQTKPLRSFGIDVTQTSMQPILDSLGIDEQVKNLSQAEKEILRYLATLKQAQIAMGDFANNLESPSNQLKIFRQQLVEAKVAVTSLFIGTYAKALPYANAFLMVIKETASAIATMFGIELKDYNTGIASQEGIYDGIADSAENANKAVKELKRQALGFDEIHNINENNDNGNGTSASGGIDQRLLDAIKGYDNGMDKVKMKATEIRDKIMEWLGFTKQIDPLTGKVSFKLKDGYSNLKLIGGVLGVLIGYKLVKNVSNLITGTGILSKLLGTGGLYKGLKSLIEPIKVLGAKDGLQYIFLNAKSSLTKFLPILGKVSIGMAGLAGVVFGSKGTYNAMKEMTKQTQYSGEQYKKYTLSVLETVAGATALGAVIGGPLGAAIGALTGTIFAGTSALLGYKAGIEELAKQELFGTISVSTDQWNEILRKNVSVIDNTSKYYDTFKSNIDSLKETFDISAESVELYGYRFGVVGEKISQEDCTKILNAVDEMASSSSKIIDEHANYSLKLWGDTFEKMSTISEDEEKNILKSILDYSTKQKSEIKNAQDNITNTYNYAIQTRGYLTDEEYNYISEQLRKIRELTTNEMKAGQADVEYYKGVFADKNQKLDEESYSNFQKALDAFNQEQLESIKEKHRLLLQDAKYYYDNDALSYEAYQGAIKEANDERTQNEEKLRDDLNKIQEEIYQNLADKYALIEGKTDATSKAQRKIIEGIFKNINIDSSDIISKFSSIGNQAGRMCAENIGMGFNSSDLKFNFDASQITGKVTQGQSFSLPVTGTFRRYANGGFPEDGWFRASHGELMGKFDNGQSVVANNLQITQGIEEAAYRGYMRAIADSGINNGHSSEIDVHVHTDEGTVIDRIEQRTKQTGVFPLTIPT